MVVQAYRGAHDAWRNHPRITAAGRLERRDGYGHPGRYTSAIPGENPRRGRIYSPV